MALLLGELVVHEEGGDGCLPGPSADLRAKRGACWAAYDAAKKAAGRFGGGHDLFTIRRLLKPEQRGAAGQGEQGEEGEEVLEHGDDLENLLLLGIEAGRATNSRDYEHWCRRFRERARELMARHEPPRSLAAALNQEHAE